jgi:hypothetical protein
MDVSIYIPEESVNVFRFHINQLANRSFDNWSFYHNPEIFKTSARGRKIACFQIPYPWDPKIEQQLDDIYEHVDYILIIGSELHAKTVDFIRKYDWKKINYFICGYLHLPMANARVYKFLDWFTTSTHFYRNVKPSILHNLNPYDTKPLMFDALLGRKKPHRDLAYNFLTENNMLDQGAVTYINDHRVNFDHTDSNKWIWQSEGIEDFEVRSQTINFTVDRVDYYGYNMSLSQIIPIDIYNRTAYSLVCETNFDNEFVFLTEKTVKPILARRLFITLGNRYHLAALRRLGFKTFDSIIDESYDSIENPTERHTAAMEQLQRLCSMDQTSVLEQAQPILDYNYDKMYSTDWYNLFRLDFGDFFFDQRNRIV